MAWYYIGWHGMALHCIGCCRWHEMASDGMGRHEMAWDGEEWHGIASDGMGWHGMAWDGGDGIGWHGMA